MCEYVSCIDHSKLEKEATDALAMGSVLLLYHITIHVMMLLHINCVKLLCTAPLQLRLNQTADGWQQQHRLAGLVLTMKC